MRVFEKILNSEQSNLLVIAAAGSGKTRLLLEVLKDRIERGKINPKQENIIVFTFTNKAAEELSVRLSKFLDSRKQILFDIFIGTIHGWCNRFLHEKEMLSNTKIIDELEQYQLLLRIYTDLGIAEAYDKRNKFRKIESFIADLEVFYNENITLNNEIIPLSVKSSLNKFLDFTKNQRLFDFGRLIRESILLLEKKERDVPNHIFIDEYQDVNPAQVNLIQSLLKVNSNSTLLAVGDPRQAIYQWRGSDVSRLVNFTKDFDNAEIFTMKDNYRSKPGIVSFANIIAKDMNFKSSLIIEDMGPKRLDNAISVIHETGAFEHEKRIVELIKDLTKENIDYSQIAVLMRSVVNHGPALLNLLEKEGIPYYSPNRNSGILFIQEFMGSIINLIEIMAKEFEPVSRSEEIEIEEEINSSLELLKKYCNHVTTDEIHLAVAEWYNELSSPIKTEETKKFNIYKNEAYNFRRQFFEFCKRINFYIKENDFEIQEGFSAITQIMRAIEEIYRRRFHGKSSSRPPPVDILLNNLRWQLNHEIERWTEIGMDINEGNQLTVSTVHAAKGLEWPIVFIPYLWTKRFPVRNSNHGTSFPDDVAGKYGTTEEDEKRLWYVAVTRARDRCYFFSGSEQRTESPFTYSNEFKKYETRMLKIEKITGRPEELSEIESFSKKRFIHMGVSDLLLLLECPYHFYLRKIKGFSVPVGEEFAAGNIIHKVIERISKGESDPEIIVEEEVYLPLAEYKHEELLKKSILRKIHLLIESRKLEGIELAEIPFTISLGNILVTGIIDAIKEKEETIEIIDWKSNIHKKFRKRYENQMLIYALGMETQSLNVSKGLVYDLNNIEQVLEIDISKDKIKNIAAKLNILLRDLEYREPKINPNKIACTICDVCFICPNPSLD